LGVCNEPAINEFFTSTFEEDVEADSSSCFESSGADDSVAGDLKLSREGSAGIRGAVGAGFSMRVFLYIDEEVGTSQEFSVDFCWYFVAQSMERGGLVVAGEGGIVGSVAFAFFRLVMVPPDVLVALDS